MQLTDQDITEFQEAYAEAFGENICAAEAREMASRVLWLYELLRTPENVGPPLDDRPVFGVRSGQRSN
ncbi:MAG TPA: hypothetical protein VFV19_18775 [Candidatus Polarisedimenticolaceae bacterium]|nr:hypothetical protein [Candidatus Polarisedimenticolaceae bacterium]